MENLTFEQKGDYAAFYACCNLLRAAGFSIASTCVGEPTGILFGDFLIAKWRNLTLFERAELHGTITGDRQHGPVTLTLLPACPEAGLTAIASKMADPSKEKE
jgi:hypothetical protein